MSVYAWLDLIGLLAYLAALGGILAGRMLRLHPDARTLALAVMVVFILRTATSLIERALAVDAIDPLNDLLRGAMPFAAGVLLYVLIDQRARGELDRREQRFRDFTEVASDWVWETDAQLRYCYVSARFEQVTGQRIADRLGRRRYEPGDVIGDPDALAEHLAVLHAHQPFRDFRYSRISSDGRARWFSTSGKPIFDAAGDFLGYRGSARDITPEVEAAEAVRDSEERFRNLIEGSIQGICIHRDMAPVFVNQAFAQMFGYAGPEAIMALGTIEPLFDSGELERVRAYNVQRRAGDPVPELYEFEGVRADGTLIVVQNVARRVSWMGQQAVQATMVDVTQRRLAERRAQADKQFIDDALDSLPGVFYLIAADGRMLRWNRAFEQESGYAADEIACMRSTDFFEGPDKALISERVAHALDAGDAVAEARFVAKDGRRMPYFFTGRRLMVDGEPCIVGMGLNIADLKQAEAALRESEARFRTLYDDNPSMYMTVDEQGVIRSVNRFGADQLGYRVDELVGARVEVLYPASEHEALHRFLKRCLAHPGQAQRGELPRHRKDGGRLWVRETARAQHTPDGTLLILMVGEDVSEARDLSQQLEFQASHDGLTGLVNRRAFELRLEHAIASAREQGFEHALCYLDLDQFKVVNDTCGHMAGDELLRQIGSVLQRCTRGRDTLARLGGDEFAVLMERCPLEQARLIAERIKTELHEYRFVWGEYSFRVGASIGVVPIRPDSPGIAHLLGRADNACYIAKEQGRNRVHVYHDDDVEVARRSGEMQWVARLDAALDAGRFRLARQPIMAIGGEQTGEHYEVLLRMVDENGALISPGAFLPAAERYGVAPRLDRWVVEQTLERLAGAPDAFASLYLCSINLSGQSLSDAPFLEHVRTLIGRSGVPPDKLCFEITETAAIANMAAAHRFIASLRELGCHFALDDFGSGLSSFAYLKSLPVDFIKIDGMFVKDIVEDPIDLAMVTAINRIGQVMGKRTIAEFVESEAVVGLLREIGVDFAQGYHIGVPQPFPARERAEAPDC